MILVERPSIYLVYTCIYTKYVTYYGLLVTGNLVQMINHNDHASVLCSASPRNSNPESNSGPRKGRFVVESAVLNVWMATSNPSVQPVKAKGPSSHMLHITHMLSFTKINNTMSRSTCPCYRGLWMWICADPKSGGGAYVCSGTWASSCCFRK